MADHLQAGYGFEQYEIRRAIRRDAIGVEYEAWDRCRNSAATVREYLPEGLSERRETAEVKVRSPADKSLFDAGRARFLVHYRTLGRIDNPAVVKVRECLSAHGTSYAILDNPEGKSLASRLENGKRLDQVELASIFEPILDGLETVHRASLLHRELNPDNIVIRVEGSPLLVGFGTTPFAASGPRQAFSPRSPIFFALLNPGYAALEQYSQRGQEGAWTDIYALGAIMYRCVTGMTAADAPGRAVHDDLIPAARAAKGLYDRQTLLGIDAALALRVAERPRSVAAWRARLPALGRAARRATAGRGRLGARRFQRPDAAGPPASRPRAAIPLPVVSARPAMAGARATHASRGTETARSGPNWAVPALAAAAVIAVLTWLDIGILRSGGVEFEGSAPEGSMASAEAGLTGQARQSMIPAQAVNDADPETAAPHVAGPFASTDANTLVPDPGAPSNISKLQVAVDRAPEAALHAALGSDIAPRASPTTEEASTVGSPETSTEGDARIGIALVPEPQPFLISTAPAGATVRFADRSISYSPDMPLAPGDYRIVVSLPGYTSWEGVVAHGPAPTLRHINLGTLLTEFADTLSSGGAGPTMVMIMPGSFRMGCVSGIDCLDSELPVREVEIGQAFALSKYEITYNEYDRFTQATRRRQAEKPSDWQRGALPVVSVSWDDAVAYTHWLSAETRHRYRLPTEAEWEYAARAQTDTAYSWGNGTGEGHANCSDCGFEQGRRGKTIRVGSFAANTWGLHDVHGNVWEWVTDCGYGPRFLRGSPTDQAISASCSSRVRRGGSWVHPARRIRSASRDVAPAKLRSLDTGFRVLLQVD